MALERVRGGIREVHQTLRLVFVEDHPPQLVAISFAIGIFLTTLPTLGGAVLVLGWLGYRFEWANRIALLAAVTIMNPLAKGSVFLLSYVVGAWLLGPAGVGSTADIGLDAGTAVLVRLLLGNLILAVVFAGLAYILALGATKAINEHRG